MLDISSFIETQFPAIYRQEGQIFVSFIKAYYEWLETQEDVDLLDSFDIDRTIDSFIEHFKRIYLNDFPFVKSSSIDFLIKHIYDYYKSKGSEESVKLLIMMLFGEEASIFAPSDYILKPSSSKWKEPRYLEVENHPSNYSFVGKQAKGVTTGASAIVESVVTKVHNGRFIDVIYISSLKGSFSTGEKVTFNGDLENAPIILGSMSQIEITNGGRDFKIGDILNVDSDYGLGGKIRVKTVVDSTGRVDFELIDGGSGYTTTPTTEIYISDGIVFMNNTELNFIDMETVHQQLEKLSILSYSGIESLLTKGRDIRGVDENGNEVAKGILISEGEEEGDRVVNLYVDTGTFINQRNLGFDGTINGATIEFDIAVTGGPVHFRIGDDVGLGPTASSFNNMQSFTVGTHHASITVPAYTTRSKIGFLSTVNNANASITNWKVTGRKLALNGESAQNINVNVNSAGEDFLNITFTPSSGRSTYTIDIPTLLGSKPGDYIETPTRQLLVLDDITGMSSGNRIEQIISESFNPSSGDLVVSGVWVNGEEFKQLDGGGILLATGKIIQNTGSGYYVDKIIYYNSATTISTSFPIQDMNETKSETVSSFTPSPALTTTIAKTHGIIESISGNDVTIYPAFGDFKTDYAVTTYSGSSQTGTSSVASTEIIDHPSRAEVSKVNGNITSVKIIQGLMPSPGGLVWNLRTKQSATVVSNSNIGATDIWIDNISTQNAIIDIISDISINAKVIGQNTSAIGVWGNTSPFITAAEMIATETTKHPVQITALGSNIINAEFGESHEFIVGDWLKCNINMQIGQEVATVDGIYEVTSVGTEYVRVRIDDGNYHLFNSVFSLFPSSFSRTTLLSINTNRAELISPPKDSNGNIIELSKYGVSSSVGSGADFKIGSIENEEIVFLESDFLKDHNVSDVPFMNIKLNGSGSGIGFLGTILINDSGTSYSNGQVITFSGGGLNGGDPERHAEAIISFVGGNGEIEEITVTDHGEGYWESPTINMPPTSGNVASLETYMNFGYGFPKMPHGDQDALLTDILNREPFTIGTISSLSSINPGQGYNANPFVKVYNPYIAGFDRRNFLVNLTDKVGSYMPGEMLVEQIGSNIFPKGVVIQDLGNTIFVKRLFFNTSFTNDSELKGLRSNSSGIIKSYEPILDSDVMGDNADIVGNVISADGIISEIDVIDSGWGYNNGDEVVLSNGDSRYIVTGIIKNITQGKGEGFWDSEESHLNSSSMIQDSDYWQEYSYEVVSPVPFEKYRDILSKILHVAGSKMFGKFEKNTDNNLLLNTNSKISIASDYDLISPYYGTGEGQIFMHLNVGDAIIDSNNHLISLINKGGAGEIYNGVSVGNPILVEDGVMKMNQSGCIIDLPTHFTINGCRVFLVGARESKTKFNRLFGHTINNWYTVLRNKNTMIVNGSTVPASGFTVGAGKGTETTISARFPRNTLMSAWELGVTSDGYLDSCLNGTYYEPQQGRSNINPISFNRMLGGHNSPHGEDWTGTIAEIIILREGSVNIDTQINAIRQYITNKWGIQF